MKDLIFDKFDFENLNENDFQIRDQHPHVEFLYCTNCKCAPGIPEFIFPKTTWMLNIRWHDLLPLGTFIQEPNKGKGKGKGKGLPPKVLEVPNTEILDYQNLPNLMELGSTYATQSMRSGYQEKICWRKSLVSVIKQQPQIYHATAIIYSGNQEHWYDGISKDNPTFIEKINPSEFFKTLKNLTKYFSKRSPSFESLQAIQRWL